MKSGKNDLPEEPGDVRPHDKQQTRRLSLIDWLSPGNFHISMVNKVLYAGKTKFQFVEIADVDSFGICLVTDGSIQSAEHDEFIYHESLVHPAMTSHSNPKNILILGGGEGATLREVVRYHSVDRVTLVDLDEELVSICRRNLCWDKGAFEDKRVELVFMDGRAYLENIRKSGGKFDVIIIDISDPQTESLSNRLFTREFYTLCSDCLEADGVLVTQGLAVYGLKDRDIPHATVHRTIASVFPKTWSYMAYITSYNSMWGFVIASKMDMEIAAGLNLTHCLSDRVDGELSFYDSCSKEHIFSLPRHIRTFIDEWQQIATDENPIVVNW